MTSGVEVMLSLKKMGGVIKMFFWSLTNDEKTYETTAQLSVMMMTQFSGNNSIIFHYYFTVVFLPSIWRCIDLTIFAASRLD